VNDKAYLGLMENLRGRGMQPMDLSIGFGWIPMVDGLMESLDELAPGRWKPTQIKEKFRGLRFYYDLDTEGLSDEEGNGLHDRVRSLVSEVEKRSYLVCESCGADGKGRATRHGHYVTLCDEHAPEGSKLLRSDD